MGSFRLPSTTLHLSATDNHKKLSCSFHKPITQSNNKTFSLLISQFPIVLPIRTSFTVKLSSSTTQDPLLELQSNTQNEKEEEEEEEFSTTRVLAANVPWSSTPEDIRALFHPFGTVVDIELSMYNKIRNRGLAFVTMGSPEEAAAAITNLQSYEFEGRTLFMNYAKIKKKKPARPSAPKPVSTFNLFVANLPFDAKEIDLKEFFKSEGADVVSAEIIYRSHDKIRKPSGYGFVAFKTKKDADSALSAFADKMFMGRPIRVARSKQFARGPREEVEQSDDTSTEVNSGTEQADASNDS
ncbi:28 kDa ribonucleoprotein, chloroplastic [Mercurialis annua]|uniref:28 kDa ribonucleoprotein, chloroplastic n=1 Tax=Mercurialis annua TaxID=3986 RepID=UPI00215FF64E|nr:28 kDa ribonucleoprotein, chloroplastic [Mercurialis annua]